jgi:modulator of FtsH protease
LTAYSSEHWTDLFVAGAGAAAALTGLVFVAVSINIERILRLEGAPERAFQTILVLLGVVVVSIFGLVPGQSRVALGLELTAESVLCLAGIAVLFRPGVRAEGASDEPSHLASRLALSVPGVLLLVVGGASMIADGGGGLYWTMAGVVVSLVGGVINAWVLLVEILR